MVASEENYVHPWVVVLQKNNGGFQTVRENGLIKNIHLQAIYLLFRAQSLFE
jgi:hypothetical protein